jgi:predicted ArsR family transcriptional regulator
VADRWTVLATLVDPSRRALYDYVRHQDHPVAREEAAEAVAMSRSLAAFHLDKLVEVGVLTARYEAPADRPRGRGRAPKVYEPAGPGLVISVPERQYGLIADILAEAVADEPGRAGEAALIVARRRGEDIGADLRPSGVDIVEVLAGLGFEPERLDGRVLLRNCPFHALAARHTTLVCGLNERFIAGLLGGLGTAAIQARPAPRPDACCVELITG